MPHDVSLITTIAAGLGLALVMGFAATRLGVPVLERVDAVASAPTVSG